MATQNHIHLDTTIGGSPENAPTNTWKATRRIQVPEVNIQIGRGITGKLFLQALSVDISTPVQFENFEYTIRLHSYAELTTLESYLGKRLKLVDHVHPADGADHTDYIKDVVMTKMSDVENLGPALDNFTANISLSDDYTVT